MTLTDTGPLVALINRNEAMAGRLMLHGLTVGDIERMGALMDKYRDKPMDLADASLVCTAECLQTRRVFTLDSDFHFYRLADGSTFDVMP